MNGFFASAASSQDAAQGRQTPRTVPAAALLRMRACLAQRVLGVFVYAWAACLALSLARSPFHGCELRHPPTHLFLSHFPRSHHRHHHSPQSTCSRLRSGATRSTRPRA